MPYQVPNNIDPNKIFLVNFSKLEGRWDPQFYKPENLDLVRNLTKRIKWKCLKTLVNFSTETWNQKDFFEKEFPYVEISEIDTSDGNIRNINYVEIAKAPSRARMVVRNGDIIISTTRPTRGAVTLVNTKLPILIASTGFSVIREVDENVILKTALFIILRLGMSLLQMGQRSSGGNYPAITQEELGKIIIPIPDLHIQQQIINVYDAALSLRKKKLNESKQKLATIDSYLLSELGITLPKKDNSLEKRIFTVDFSKVCGERLDPKCYSTESQLIKDAVSKGSYECRTLKRFLVHSIAGDWGYDENEEITNTEKCLVIRSTEFDNEYNLKLDNSRAKYRNILKNKLDNINLQVGDLLIEKSGGSEEQPVGRVAIITDEILSFGNICYSNFIHKISVTDILPEYLYCYLKTAYNIKLTDSMQSQTNGLRNLILKEYFNQLIPLPPLEKQREISDKIAAIRAEAKRLEQEGEEILQSARQQVEEMILGEK